MLCAKSVVRYAKRRIKYATVCRLVRQERGFARHEIDFVRHDTRLIYHDGGFVRHDAFEIYKRVGFSSDLTKYKTA